MKNKEIEKRTIQPQWLTGHYSELITKDVIDLNHARAHFTVFELVPKQSWIVLKEADGWLEFAVLQWCLEDGENTFGECVFHGYGSSGLKECRHTWWGEDGYLFYPPGPTIIAAFQFLSKFFDDMA